jgi:hypothetical protein
LTLTRRQALALAATAPVAAVLPAVAPASLTATVTCVPSVTWEAYLASERAYWAAVNAQAARNLNRALASMCRVRDRLQQTTRPPVQLSIPYPPQEIQDNGSA